MPDMYGGAVNRSLLPGQYPVVQELFQMQDEQKSIYKRYLNA